jgi:F-type H+-transporting ATPase subunit delta
VLRRRSSCVSKSRDFEGFKALPEPRRKFEVPLEFQGLAPPDSDGAPPAELFDESIDVAGEGLIVSGMAGRYATALFELALEEHAIDAVRADLDRFDALLNESPDLLRLVRSPVFTADEQLKSLSAILDRAGISGIAANFLKVVTVNRRLFAVRDLIRGYRQLVARHKGEVTAEVTLAEKPNDAHLAAIKDALRAVTKKDVQIDVKVDPSIIGGLIVKLGSRMVDSSLRTKLNSIKHAMKEAR